MNRASDISLLKETFDKQFPVSSDLRRCLETVHSSYQLFKIHEGHTEKDGHLEEGLFSVHHVILHCVKDILACGKTACDARSKSPCAVQPVSTSGSNQTANSSAY